MIDMGKVINIQDIKIFEQDDFKFKDSYKEGNLRLSIKKYGQLKPILINEDNEILEGFQLYKALKDSDAKDIWVKIVPNRKELRSELHFLSFELNAIRFYESLRDMDLNDTCIPLPKEELNKYVELLNFKWENFSKKNSYKENLF